MEIIDSSAMVTGGASGLGFATARALKDAGAEVVIIDLPSSDGKAAASEIGATFSPGDVTDADSVAEAVSTLR